MCRSGVGLVFGFMSPTKDSKHNYGLCEDHTGSLMPFLSMASRLWLLTLLDLMAYIDVSCKLAKFEPS